MKRFLNIFAAIVALGILTGCYEEIDLVEGTAYTTINYTTNDNEIADIRTYSMHVISNTYANGVGKVVVKGKMTVFYNYFEDCDNVTSVTIPKGVTSIKNYAFSSCNNLKSITVPEGVIEIANSAFSFCDKLTNVTLPSTLEKIGSNAFYDCDALASITLPKALVTIGSGAFEDCDALVNIVIPDNVTTIESWTFEGCNALKSVTIGRSVKTIETKAFYNCTNLKTVINNSSLTFTKGSSGYGYIAYYAEKITQKQSNYNNRSYVDLGLPSGVKWAAYNIGASSPEVLGSTFYWGETTTSMVNNTMYVNVGNDISGNAKYDAARAQWGGDWRLPTREEIKELVNNCTWYWSSYNGVSGCKVYGPNGNYIFLPYTSNYYWSSTSMQWDKPNDAAYVMYVESEEVSANYYAYRYSARYIRPVIN